MFYEFSAEPNFVDGLHQTVQITGQSGENVRLMCKVESNPASYMTWYKGEEILKASKR